MCLHAKQSDDQQETMPLSSFYVRKRPARQILFSPPHYLSKSSVPGLVCTSPVFTNVVYLLRQLAQHMRLQNIVNTERTDT